MSISVIKVEAPRAEKVSVTNDTLRVELSDGRTISAPLGWFPRLLHGTISERNDWRLIGKGEGIHWETLDEDISVEGLLAGRPSGESQVSLERWLTRRQESRKPRIRSGPRRAGRSKHEQ